MEVEDRDAAPLLEAHQLYRFFHTGDAETFALRGVSMTLSGGEFVAVVGPSGSGKSTLLACLAGLDDPTGGYVEIAGERMTRRDETTRARLRARSIGMLLQSGNLIDHLSVAENIRLAQTFRGTGGDETDGSIHDLLTSVGLHEHAAATPSTLSGGEAARAGLAVALANDPSVLLADEPTGEVDAATEAALIELLKARAERGRAVVVVTHSSRVSDAADRTIELLDGSVRNG